MRPPIYRGVLLAAGGSRRFEGPVAKQLVAIDGEPAVRRAARRALESGLDRVVVVTGHVADQVCCAVDGLPIDAIHNPLWQEGQSGSVRAGLRAVQDGAEAVVFLPCDQPFLTAGLIDQLIARHARGEAAIVVPVWRGRRGAPVLIDRCLFPELAAIRGDAGARQLFGSHAVVEMPVADGRQLLDFDSRETLARLIEPAAPRGGDASGRG